MHSTGQGVVVEGVGRVERERESTVDAGGRGPGEGAGEGEVGLGGPPFAVDFSGLFFTGDGPRLPG